MQVNSVVFRSRRHIFLFLVELVLIVEPSLAIPADLDSAQKLKMVTCSGKLNFDKTTVTDTVSFDEIDLSRDAAVLVEVETKSVPIGQVAPESDLIRVVKDGTTGPAYRVYTLDTFEKLPLGKQGQLPDPHTRLDLRETDKIMISLPRSASTENLIESGEILKNDAVQSFFKKLEARTNDSGLNPTSIRFGRIELLYGSAVGGLGLLIVISSLNEYKDDSGGSENNSNTDQRPLADSSPVQAFDFSSLTGTWRKNCISESLSESGALKAFCLGKSDKYFATKLENARSCLNVSTRVSEETGLPRLICLEWKSN